MARPCAAFIRLALFVASVPSSVITCFQSFDSENALHDQIRVRWRGVGGASERS